MTTDDSIKISLARDYFRLADTGDPAVLDLFTDDVQLYFPKFGVAHGKMAFVELGTGIAKLIANTAHDTSDYLFVPCGDVLAVEGSTTGTTVRGVQWVGGETPGGRFCNIFEFRDGLISRVHVYLDPDYGSEDLDRFHWGQDGRAW